MAAIVVPVLLPVTTTSAFGRDVKPVSHFANVKLKYCEHNRHRLDIWLADSSKPTPLAVYIHGGCGCLWLALSERKLFRFVRHPSEVAAASPDVALAGT